MGFQMPHAVKLILVTESSLIITFYGPIVGTALLIIVLLFVRAATVLRLPITTRPRPRKRSGRETSIPAFTHRGTRCRGHERANGNARWMEGR